MSSALHSPFTQPRRPVPLATPRAPLNQGGSLPAPLAPATYNPGIAINTETSAHREAADYANQSFNDWYGGLHPDEAKQFRPQKPLASSSVVTGSQGTSSENNPDDHARADNAQRAAARNHFNLNILANDEAYQAKLANAANATHARMTMAALAPPASNERSAPYKPSNFIAAAQDNLYRQLTPEQQKSFMDKRGKYSGGEAGFRATRSASGTAVSGSRPTNLERRPSLIP